MAQGVRDVQNLVACRLELFDYGYVPNPYLIGIKEADEVDEFLELPFREQFDDCFFYLRKNSPKLEIKDDPQYRFGQEYDFMHINKMFQ